MSRRGAVTLLVTVCVAVTVAVTSVVVARDTSPDERTMVGVVSQLQPRLCVARAEARGDCFAAGPSLAAGIHAGDCVRATYRASDLRLVGLRRIARQGHPDDCPGDYVPPVRTTAVHVSRLVTPVGRLTPLECPDGAVDGLPRWYGEETPAADPLRRARVLGVPVRRAHPDARLRRAGHGADAVELAWLSPAGLRVGRVAFVRADSGRWLVREWEWC